MTKTRVPKGEKYWSINMFSGLIEVGWIIETNLGEDKRNFEIGNYFYTKEEAEAMARKLRAIFRADVIEMPSEDEFETMVQDLTHEITCGGHDRMYAVDEQGKILDNITYEEVADIIRNTVERLKSKIVK